MPVICWSAHASSCLEGEAMTRKTWVLAIASVLVSVILLDGQVCATDADGRKKIAVFLDGTPLDVQQQPGALAPPPAVRPRWLRRPLRHRAAAPGPSGSG
jgi:hypothetical protein